MNMKKTLWFSVILIMITPMIFGVLVSIPSKVTIFNDWIGFFGNYTGGLLGGAIALIVSKYQVDKSDVSNKNQLDANKENLLMQLNEVKQSAVIEKAKQEIPTLVILKDELDYCKYNINMAMHTVKNPPPEMPEEVVYRFSFTSINKLKDPVWNEFYRLQDSKLILNLLSFKRTYNDAAEYLYADLKNNQTRMNEIHLLLGKISVNDGNPETIIARSKLSNELQDLASAQNLLEVTKKSYIKQLQNDSLMEIVENTLEQVTSKIEIAENL